MLKVSENPSMLPLGLQSVSELSGNWWVAHTKARNEKALARDLSDAGIGYYLPLVKRTTFSGGRRRHGMYPLFLGYVFIVGDKETRYRALTTNRVCQVIPVIDQETMTRELCSIEQAIRSGLSVGHYPFAAVGNRCRVARGPLQGIQGVVVRCDNKTRLILQVSVLGNGASLEIDADLLEAAE